MERALCGPDERPYKRRGAGLSSGAVVTVVNFAELSQAAAD